jgi:GNAT superfamily N-acetyltransferase
MDLGKFSQRALTEEDAAAYVAFAAAVGAADDDPTRLDETGFLELLRFPLAVRDLQDFTGWFDGERLAAAGWVARASAAQPVHWMRSQGAVHPDYRGLGLGTALIRWQQELAPKIHDRFFPGHRLELSVGAMGGNTAALELFAQEGFAPLRWYFEMLRPEDAPVAEDRAPEGLEFLPYTDAQCEELRLAHNEAFVDHFRATPHDRDFWNYWIGQEKIRKDLSFLLRDARTGELAGFLVSSASEAEFAATGVRDVHFNLIGTLSPFRRRGVASALIAHAVHASRRLGFQTATLGVDAENPTGALGVYEKAGFVCAHRHALYNKVLVEGAQAGAA